MPSNPLIMSLKNTLRIGSVGLLLLTGACSSNNTPTIGNDILDSRIIEDLIENANEFQRSILEDGIVTTEEYMWAAEAELDCIRSHSEAITSELYWQEDMLVFDLEWKVPEHIADSMNDPYEYYSSIEKNCANEYSSYVHQVVALQRIPNPDQRKEIREELMQCVQRLNFSVDSGLTDLQLAEWLSLEEQKLWQQASTTDETEIAQVFSDCLDEHYMFFLAHPGS